MNKFLGLLFLFAVTVTVVGGSRLLRLNDSNAISSERSTSVYLHEQVDLERLSTMLDDSVRVIKDKEELLWAAKLLGWRTFQPGHYKIDHGFTYDEFLSKLAKGNQDPVTLTLIPGQSQGRLGGFLATKLRFDSLAIKNVLQDTSFLAANDITPKTLVGHFFPATYDLYWTSSPEVIMERIFKEFNNQVIVPHKGRLRELDKSLNEIIALASIVEWEAARDDEKPKISGLYWNRLNRGMLLQADPTVNFAVNKRRRLFFSDYKVDHPYNTYVNQGLPPGPITNPSLSSIKAALFPAQHDYLYMVARPNGYHAFTETYADHQRKSAEWRNYLQEQERIKEARQKDQDSL